MSGKTIIPLCAVVVIYLLLVGMCAGLFNSSISYAQAASRTYYVSTSGNDTNDGLTEATAWRTITYAATQAQAGDIIKIKGGYYGHEHVVIENSGTKGNPIIFEGYDGTPVLDGEDRSGVGILIESKSYIILRNFKLTNYGIAVQLTDAEHITVEGCTISDIGTGTAGRGIALSRSHYCTIRRCSITDASMHNISIYRSTYNLIEGCSLNAVTEDGVGDWWQPDYHIHLWAADHNTIKNCIARNLHPLADMHPGHAIVLKEGSAYNTIIGCEAYGMGEFFAAAHYSHHNEFRDCVGFDEGRHSKRWNHGLVARDGAHNNKFVNCRMFGATVGVEIVRTSESPANTIQENNIFDNCIVCCYEYGYPYRWSEAYAVFLYNAKNNTIKNCVIGGCDHFLLIESGVEEGNVLMNSIVVDFPNEYYGQVPNIAIRYTNFWNVGFSVPPGTGNMTADPLFVDPDNKDYHLRSTGGRWDAENKRWVIDSQDSPCIDAGDPASDYSNEPEPNGNRVNLGAYGNTPEASLTPGGDRGALAGTVIDVSTGLPIEGAVVNAGGWSATTASDGSYLIPSIPVGAYTVTCSKTGYETASQDSVEVVKDSVTTLNFQLTKSDTTPPEITLKKITVNGSVGDDSVTQVQINGVSVPVTAGKYSYEVDVSSTNTITITATNSKGETVTRAINVR